ncbi:diphosphomevalonate decarboxylase [Chryseobacterium sp. A301]
MHTEFLALFEAKVFSTSVKQMAPSNIALVKYWGKYAGQIPANPSISYTLKNCNTQTEMSFDTEKPFGVELYLAGEKNPAFSKKIETYFKTIQAYLPWITKGFYEIHTENSFPHSSGIASSASGFAALAKCLMALDEKFGSTLSQEQSLQKASFLARLGSGSAARSLHEGLVVWGEIPEMEKSSSLYGLPYPSSEVHPLFRSFNDWVLLIHEGEKSVSSTVGHSLMNDHPYAERRFEEARENLSELLRILKAGDLQAFIKLVEHEALTLHALMMMSNPAYLLMKSGTLEVINEIWNFRKETGHPLFFTLDAGANVHLLFPQNESREAITTFIETSLKPLTQKGGIVKDEMVF